ncbi:hypothetical protein HY416_00820 [Candidatus Kaiserbacteria bacterium]|nr:hypothetical protein [Candidatus Kaiserbacteria bacterium]
MRYRTIAGGIAVVGIVIVLSNIVLPQITKTTYESAASTDVRTDALSASEETPPEAARSVRRHMPLPSAVKAAYMTACAVGTPTLRDSIVSLVEQTEINALVIDIKDYSGKISFAPSSPELMPAWNEADCGARDMQAFIEILHQKNIYVIGRITVFQDPYYSARHPELAVTRASDGAVWRDRKGLSFIDVGAKAYWNYIVTLAVESYDLGFDELNFDYVRYPSDGNMQDIAFTHSGGKNKQENLELFFEYLHGALSDPSRYEHIRHENTGRDTATPYLSVDLFGMTTSNTDDLSIGQVQERAAPYFDFVAPMVYPSHYPHGFNGLGNPNHYPYDVVHFAMKEGARRMAATTTPVDGFLHERVGTSTPATYKKPAYSIQKLRPWLQDFDYGGQYGVAEVRAQIKAAYDAGLTSWMVWDPANRYTRDAYLPE